MNPLKNKTPEERKTIHAKGLATRRANSAAKKEAQERARLEAMEKRNTYKAEIAALEEKRDKLARHQTATAVSIKIDGKYLLEEDAIVAASTPWESACGVYFLIKNKRVVYVGQSVNVFGRIATHVKEKDFDSVAYVQCERRHLNKYEALYIHFLKPELNGNYKSGAMRAPIPLYEILSL